VNHQISADQPSFQNGKQHDLSHHRRKQRYGKFRPTTSSLLRLTLTVASLTPFPPSCGHTKSDTQRTGIGLALSAALLLRPNTTVIATVRNSSPASASTSALRSSPTAAGSSLVVLQLDSTDAASFTAALATLSASHPQITRIDTLIANAGSSPGYHPIISTPPSDLVSAFNANTVGLLLLFQTFYSLLSASSQPKLFLVSSSLGSISALTDHGSGPSLAYGISKAAANFLVRKVHFECPLITAVAINPGWVKTSMGQGFADAVGYSEPPMTIDECIKGFLIQVCRRKSIIRGLFANMCCRSIRQAGRQHRGNLFRIPGLKHLGKF
jgi:norsolorinic acid ketoreductase